ncbi:DNA-binding response regulator [Clostridiales bacterium]|nr:DNA-binding response regulator [Clostridiales bacterium]
MWNILIYNSDTEEREALANQVQQILSARETLSMSILSFCKAESLRNHVMRCLSEAAIVFLDLSPDKKSGLQLGKKILEAQPNTQLIFLSAYDEGHWDVYEVEHVYALRKPAAEEYVKQALDRAMQRLWEKRRTEPDFVVKSKRGIQRIPLNRILYFEKEKRKIHLHTLVGKHSFYGKFSDIIDQADRRFLRCHSGYMVNITQAQELLDRQFVFENGVTIPISRTYYTEVRQAYLKYLSERTEKMRRS